MPSGDRELKPPQEVREIQGNSALKADRKHRNKNKNKQSRGVAHCPGFSDEYGIWNTGFDCPKWGGPDEQYCCGSATKRFCCEEPAALEPVTYDRHIPLIAGASAAVTIIVIVIVSCFVCRCCPGYKRVKRSRSPGSRTVESRTCRRCHRATAALDSSPDTLACGCPIGGPPIPHHHLTNMSTTLGDSSDILLLENTNVNSPVVAAAASLRFSRNLTEFPVEEPPPYRERDGHHASSSSVQSTSEDGTYSATYSYGHSSSELRCMTTFQPLSPLLSPTSSMRSHSPGPVMLPHPNELKILEDIVESSRRDSGCIEDQQDMQDQDEQDFEETDASSIVVPSFNFQSLTLCRALKDNKNKTNGVRHPLEISHPNTPKV